MRYFEYHLEEALKNLPARRVPTWLSQENELERERQEKRREAQSKAPFKWISPDDLYEWDESSIAFIYDSNGELKLGDDTHVDIIDEHINYYKELDGIYSSLAQLLMAPKSIKKPVRSRADMDPDAEYSAYDIRMQLEHVALLGRVGEIKDTRQWGNSEEELVEQPSAVVSFWNEKMILYSDMLDDCLRELEFENLVTKDTLVSLPNFGTVTKDAVSKQDDTKSDEEILRRQAAVKLARELHTMPPWEKKAAQKKLLELGMAFGGVGGGGHKHAWQKALEDAGYINPGQKWWAMYSEERMESSKRIKKNANLDRNTDRGFIG